MDNLILNNIIYKSPALKLFKRKPSASTLNWKYNELPSNFLSTITTVISHNGNYAFSGSSTSSEGNGLYGSDLSNLAVTTTPRYGELAAFGKGIYVLVRANSNTVNTYSYSTDFQTYSQGTLPLTTKYSDLIFDGTQFLLLTNDNKYLYSSLDGLSWSSITLSSNKYWQQIIYNGSKYLIIGRDYVLVGTLDSFESVNTDLRFTNVIWDGKRYVGIDQTGRYCYTSQDGKTWSQITPELPIVDSENISNDGRQNNWGPISYNGKLYVATHDAGSGYSDNRYIYSSNLREWTIGTLPKSGRWNYLYFIDNHFILCGNSSGILYT